MTPFFVTGLPRSRTAWLSAWLTTDNSICWHDVEYDPVWLSPEKRIGFAGPELVNQVEQIEAEHPFASWLVIRRNPDESLAAFRTWAGKDIPKDDATLMKIWEDRVKLLLALSLKPRSMSVEYGSELDNENIAAGIWNHLLPGLPFDGNRFKAFRQLNIQQRKDAEWPLVP